MAAFFITLLLVIVTVFAQSQEGSAKVYRSDDQELKLIEKKRATSVNIDKYNFRSYNFKLKNNSDFLLKPEEDQIIRAAFKVFWNNDGTYSPASIQKGQEVSLQVQTANHNILISQQFYTSTGFTFNVTRGSTYYIFFKQNGAKTKIINMYLSETVIPSNKTAKRDRMARIQEKLRVAEQKVKNSLELSSSALFLQRSVSAKIHQQSVTYSHFEILEALFIVLVSCVEVKLIANLLNSDIVV